MISFNTDNTPLVWSLCRRFSETVVNAYIVKSYTTIHYCYYYRGIIITIIFSVSDKAER
jgi:hypothetical protein